MIRATEDTYIEPQSCKNIQVNGPFDDDREWLLEKEFMTNSKENFLITPNVLFTSRNPVVPISNVSYTPRYVRKGKVIGHLKDPRETFDNPKTVEELEEYKKNALLVKDLVKTVNLSPSSELESACDKKSANSRFKEEEESYGPKTAEFPESEIYPSEQIEELLDVGDLPNELKNEAWRMLKKHMNAFGFDGRLGHHPSKVQVRTKENQVPISLPMYGSSPAKREIIDDQINKWYEQDVIEPSRSPWGAPVVIAYRNGKPRFCVDYRKLNAVTIPDEFPLPRQSEILASLTGSQVLSSLDALSGFTQLEMDPEHIEKTAFRTHRGLFQFKRMPFGL